MIIVTYVYNCLIFSPLKSSLDNLLNILQKTFNLPDKGEDVTEYLGIKVEKHPDGTIKMTQQALIQRILRVLDLDGKKVQMHNTPANVVLIKEEDRNARQQDWNYRSVIGMTMFVATSTRPDIAFTVHQCEKINADPKRYHKEAVKQIGQYLRRMSTKGLSLKSNETQRLDCYAEANFAGAFCRKIVRHPSSVLSRT